MVFRWREGYRGAVPADVAGRELARIEGDGGGEIRPGAVVDAARPEGAPLHPCFEWNDTRAAEAYRKQQARHLVRSLVTVVAAEPARSVPTYVNVIKGSPVDRSYQPSSRMTDPDVRRAVLDEALRQLTAFTRRYRYLNELEGVFLELDAAQARRDAEEARKRARRRKRRAEVAPPAQ